MQAQEYKNKGQIYCADNISDSTLNANEIKEPYYKNSEETQSRNYSANGYGEQKGNMWLLKRSRKGMELNNPLAFNLKPQSLRSVIDRIPLLPYVGCSQLEYVLWRKKIQPCVPDSRYLLNERTDERIRVISPREEISTYSGNRRIGYRKYNDIPKISKSDCMCCGNTKENQSYSDAYMPVATETRVDQRLSKQYPPISHSKTISLSSSEESSIYIKSTEAMKEIPLPPHKKKGFGSKLYSFCCGYEEEEHQYIFSQEAPRYVCKQAAPSLSGSSLFMVGGEQRQRRTRYLCRPES